MAAQNLRLRPLFVMEILLKYTDEEHRLNTPQIMEILEKEYGLACDRRTIYLDVEQLKIHGMDIQMVKGSSQGYYVSKREFAMAELKILVDAVQSAKFIPQEQAMELVKKLEGQCSRYQAQQLKSQVTILGRSRTENAEVYQQVETIHDALYLHRKVRFQYTAWDVWKKRVVKHGGKYYLVSPQSLVYDDEYYYLVGRDEEAGFVKHFRVDKVTNLSMLEEQACEEEFNASAFAKKTFGMYSGEDMKVVLRGKRALVGTVIDHFGTDAYVRPDGEEYFRCTTEVTVSPTFFGWILGLGPDIEILSPPQVRQDFENHLRRVLGVYEKEKPDFVLSRKADEIKKSASDPSRQVETGVLEDTGAPGTLGE